MKLYGENIKKMIKSILKGDVLKCQKIKDLL